ncbi:hypothetical protein ACFVAQ_03010 [Streptomyces sp. NPDC057651]|uniref:hypothetical protein n=1 Tax=Streptomyces sp. NPDC057651 TaxID=3346194 RepID=UPI0036AB95C5
MQFVVKCFRQCVRITEDVTGVQDFAHTPEEVLERSGRLWLPYGLLHVLAKGLHFALQLVSRARHFEEYGGPPAVRVQLGALHEAGDVLARVAEREEQTVTGAEVGLDALKFQRWHVLGGIGIDRSGNDRTGRKLVPFGAGVEILRGLEDLGQSTGRWSALHLRASRDGAASAGVEGVGEEGAGCEWGARPVTDQPSESDQGLLLGRGAQITFVGDAFLIERQDVSDQGPALHESDGRIVGLTGGQRRERRVIRT